MLALINHKMFQWFESDSIKIGGIFQIKEAEKEDGLLILVIYKFLLCVPQMILIIIFHISVKYQIVGRTCRRRNAYTDNSRFTGRNQQKVLQDQ